MVPFTDFLFGTPSDVIFYAERDWAAKIRADRKSILTEQGVNALELEQIVSEIDDAKVCQSFTFVQDMKIVKAVVLIGPTPRNFEFDQCLYQAILNVFGFKVGKRGEPSRFGERLDDLNALSILYSIDASERIPSKLQGSVRERILEKYLEK